MSAASTPKRRHETGQDGDTPASKRARHGAGPHLSDGSALANSYMSDGIAAPIKHQPGAIRRVKLKNFVTYSSVEFFPGPSLNMVIGPNGTGKSTLVCAICIGFGYDPKHLGRAKDVAEFVKHGSNEARIEIEVERPPNRPKHPVFKCTIKRDGNKATFSIDEKPFSGRQVKDRAERLGVQINNLCQFLPQDRVVEFSRMTPVELLQETQRAIGSRRMRDAYERLKTTRKDQRTLDGQKQDHTESLASLEAKHRMQEADVQRIRERDEVKANVEFLERVRPFRRYQTLKDLGREQRAQHDSLTTEVQRLEESIEPFVKELRAKQRYSQDIEAGVVQRTASLSAKLDVVKDLGQEIDNLDRAIADIDTKRRSEKATVKTSEAEFKRISEIIRNLRLQHSRPPPVSQTDLDTKAGDLRRCEREKRELQDDATESRTRLAHLTDQRDQRQKRIARTEEQIEGLQSKSGQQVHKLKKAHPEAFRAYEWLQRNRNKFEKEVYGPPLIECSVTDPNLADMVETALPPSEMQVFTTQTMNDFKLLQRNLREMGISRVNQRTVSVGIDVYRSKANQDHLQRFGLTGWIIDLIEGPEVVRASLCEGAKVHLTGYCLQELGNGQFEDLKQSDLNRIMTTKTSYQFQRRREYGPQASNVVTRELNRAKFWTDAPVDTSAISEMRRSISELTDEMNALESERVEIATKKRDSLKTRNEQLDNEIKTLRDAKAEMQRQLQGYRALPTRIQKNEEDLAGHQQTITNYRERDRGLVKESDGLALRKATMSTDYAEAVLELHTTHDALQEIKIMRIEAISDREVLEARHAETTQQVEAKRQERDESAQTAKQTLEEAQATGREAKASARKYGQEFVDKVKEVLQNIASPDELDAEIESEKARLELMQGDRHGNTLAEYEKRDRQITQLKETLEKMNESLAEMAEIITEARSAWEPELDRLVGFISHSFSYNMKQINCAGEVGIHKDEYDFDQWSIKIMVKFRDNESLSQLDSHRQSGGERAVSTVFYLMSLQTLTVSPFRVVDEINQGMDPRNERLVHARMVAIATGTDDMPAPVLRIPRGMRDEDEDEADGEGEGEGEDPEIEEEPMVDPGRQKGSQYFLITPKLLPDLKYERGMRVLCIASGDHMPSAESNAVDFGKQLEIRRSMLAAAA